MTNVVVAKKRVINVSANGTSGVLNTSTPVTIKNNPSLGGGVSRLDQLGDVVASLEEDGATLVYDATTDRYVVKKLSFDDMQGDLDGGTF